MTTQDIETGDFKNNEWADDDEISCESGQTYMSLLSIFVGFWLKSVTG